MPVDYNRLPGHSPVLYIYLYTGYLRYVVAANIDIKGTMGQNGVTDYAGRDRIKRI